MKAPEDGASQFEALKQELSKRQDVRAEYDALGEEFAVAEAEIRRRDEAGTVTHPQA